MKKVIQSSILLSLTLTLFAFDLPSGWFTAGSKPNSYEMGIEKTAQKGIMPQRSNQIQKKQMDLEQ